MGEKMSPSSEPSLWVGSKHGAKSLLEVQNYHIHKLELLEMNNESRLIRRQKMD